MNTIENIKVEKTFYKREKDIFGNVTRTPYKRKVTRGLNVVNQGIRFLYYLVDIFLYIGVSLVIEKALSYIIYSIQDFETAVLIVMIYNLFSYSLLFFYYFLTESLFGASPAKIMFGYTVIDAHANKPSTGRIALRSIIRYVPFEAFSCLGERGWHDKWSKTYVVKRKERDELKQLVGKVQNEDILD
ncbi:MAG: RDD family protein [Crocinitomicaceae bacterium]|nr:RDD family protein [Crocinitomicaceae bacterium]NGF74990.1 RDD family protein [Fluviicola sp. SGL-29]